VKIPKSKEIKNPDEYRFMKDNQSKKNKKSENEAKIVDISQILRNDDKSKDMKNRVKSPNKSPNKKIKLNESLDGQPRIDNSLNNNNNLNNLLTRKYSH